MSVAAAPVTDDDAEIPLLVESRRYCAQITRDAAKNFYYGLKLLPEPKRSAMFALYAYMRLLDDIADAEDGRSVEQRERDLEQWRVETHAALTGQIVQDRHRGLWPALADMCRRYKLPEALLDEAIAGQHQDLRPVVFDTFEQLYEYCYRVAGVVGLASIRIWHYQGGAQTEEMAVARGVAFQITNILRDLREDAARGRVYIPTQDLAEYGIVRDDLLRGRGGSGFVDLVRAQITRVESFYERSASLESCIDVDSRSTLVAMTDIYRALLRKIADDPQRVLRERVSLSLVSKLRIGWRATRAFRQRGPG